jgi:hypothetical protein
LYGKFIEFTHLNIVQQFFTNQQQQHSQMPNTKLLCALIAILSNTNIIVYDCDPKCFYTITFNGQVKSNLPIIIIVKPDSQLIIKHPRIDVVTTSITITISHINKRPYTVHFAKLQQVLLYKLTNKKMSTNG